MSKRITPLVFPNSFALCKVCVLKSGFLVTGGVVHRRSL